MNASKNVTQTARTVSLVDCAVQSLMIAFVIITVGFSYDEFKFTVTGLYVALFLGIYQLINAVVRTIMERKTMHFPWLVIYWIGVVISMVLLYWLRTQGSNHSERVFYLIISTPVILAIYYCVICWRITLNMQTDES